MASAVGCTATHINARGIRMLVNPTLMPGDLVLLPGNRCERQAASEKP